MDIKIDVNFVKRNYKNQSSNFLLMMAPNNTEDFMDLDDVFRNLTVGFFRFLELPFSRKKSNNKEQQQTLFFKELIFKTFKSP